LKELNDLQKKVCDHLSLYESYEMELITGRMDYPTFLDKLAGKEVGITDAMQGDK
jgi:hypothetical protein